MKKFFSFSAKSLAVMLLALVAAACTKSVAGPKGDPGTPAGKGNLTYEATGVITVNPIDWKPKGFDWQTYIYLPDITDDVLAKGEVKVYKLVGTSWWCPPYSVGDIFTQCVIQKGVIHISLTKNHSDPPAPNDISYFRVVITKPAS